jgi:hypothetical protein
MVRLRRDGAVEVGPGDADGLPTAWIRHPAVRSGDELNTLRVVGRAGRLREVSVNGSAIPVPIPLRQPLVGPVTLSLILWQRNRGDQEARAEFNRFTLWQLPPSAPAAS